uniref:CCHC-type domain-containing protein n=1 Tax=Magallana gigas TaxID=29159 RepID=A0A8W8NDD7_MAGGI
MAAPNDDFLQRVSEIMDSKLSSFEQKISKQQKQQHEQQLSRIQAANDKTFVFKRKGNEAQYKFNNSVREKLIEANTSLSEGEPEMAFNSISSGIELIHQRQKLIKLADSSKTGWRTVQEYTQHELASDEEDEKRIFKAEIRAEKKLKEERIQKARTARRTNPYPERASSVQNQPKSYENSKKSGTCFKCGFPGHWAKNCTTNNNNKETGSKLSTLDSNVQSMCIVQSKDLHACMSEHFSESKNNVCRFVATIDENVSPVGRLRGHLTKWVDIQADKYILDVIENGYKIPFKTIPNSVCLDNNKSARDNVKVVGSEIQKLIDKGCVTEVKNVPFVVNPLTLAFNKTGAEDFDQASTLSEVIKRDLTELGFIIAGSKSVWFPQQNIVWLGFEWDMSNGILKVTQERVRKLLSCIEEVYLKSQSGCSHFRVKSIASIAGQIISMENAIGNAVSFKTRPAARKARLAHT